MESWTSRNDELSFAAILRPGKPSVTGFPRAWISELGPFTQDREREIETNRLPPSGPCFCRPDGTAVLDEEARV